MKIIIDFPSLDKDSPSAEIIIDWLKIQMEDKIGPLKYAENIKIMENCSLIWEKGKWTDGV